MVVFLFFTRLARLGRWHGADADGFDHFPHTLMRMNFHFI
jgi:hypothetical protein